MFDFNDAPKCADIWAGEENRIVHTPNLTMMTFAVEKGWQFKDKGHLSDQITIVLEGVIEMEVNGKKAKLEPGQGVYIPSFASHSGRIISQEAHGLDIFFPLREEPGYQQAIKLG
jgi:quercetin dioxygenase-like cupin family protein